MGEHRIRCGDHVHHGPSDETWVVAWADYDRNDLAWCGWPNGMARLSDCTLVRAATDEEHRDRLICVLDCGDSRSQAARLLYGDPRDSEAAHG